jgi:hypothetical protein
LRRCNATWFAGRPKSAPDVTAFVDNAAAEAETQPAPMQAASNDFGAEASESITAIGTETPPDRKSTLGPRCRPVAFSDSASGWNLAARSRRRRRMQLT